MTDIHHRIGVTSSSADDVYAALTTIDGLSGWWTTDTQGDPGLGGKIEFRFPQGGFDMEVIELTPGELVRWRVTDGPPEWIGTTIDWRLGGVGAAAGTGLVAAVTAGGGHHDQADGHGRHACPQRIRRPARTHPLTPRAARVRSVAGRRFGVCRFGTGLFDVVVEDRRWVGPRSARSNIDDALPHVRLLSGRLDDPQP
jgi:uncharacterized protein YndB with AHSA1/START domain